MAPPIISGENYHDEFGRSVSLSADGSIVAIGAPNWRSEGKNETGLVRVYYYNKNIDDWSRLGNDIIGEKDELYFGFSVSLSASGTVLASAPDIGGSSDSVCIHIVHEFDKSKNQWVPRGGCFKGSSLGNRIKLSATGLVVVLGNQRIDDGPGKVEAFKYNVYANKWNQLGRTINGIAEDEMIGTSIDLSSDGTVLSIAGRINYPAKVYELNDITNEWEQRGQDIVANGGWDFDSSLSASGSVLIVAYLNSVDIFLYDEITNRWQLGTAVFPDSDFKGMYPKVHSSADGITVVVTAEGRVEIFRLSVTNGSSCEGDKIHFNLTITPDHFPQDIYWKLQNQEGNKLIGGKLGEIQPNTQISDPLVYIQCLENNSHFYFFIEDLYGDGICCDWGKGSFSLEWNNIKVLDNYNFTDNKYLCLPTTDDLSLLVVSIENFQQFMGFALYDSKGDLLMKREGISKLGENRTFSQCVRTDDCLHFGFRNIYEESTVSVKIYKDNKLVYETSGKKGLYITEIGRCNNIKVCPEDHKLFEMDVGTNVCSTRHFWEIQESNKTLVSGGNYTNAYSYYYYKKCFPKFQEKIIFQPYELLDLSNRQFEICLTGGSMIYNAFWEGKKIQLEEVIYVAWNISLGKLGF